MDREAVRKGNNSPRAKNKSNPTSEKGKVVWNK